MAREPTPEAIRLHEELLRRDVPAELEKWDGYKHIDIAIVEAQLNIEIDGFHHNTRPTQAIADLRRTYHSHKKGFYTLRIPNSLLRYEDKLQETADLIVSILNDRLDQLDEDY